MWKKFVFLGDYSNDSAVIWLSISDDLKEIHTKILSLIWLNVENEKRLGERFECFMSIFSFIIFHIKNLVFWSPVVLNAPLTNKQMFYNIFARYQETTDDLPVGYTETNRKNCFMFQLHRKCGIIYHSCFFKPFVFGIFLNTNWII